MRGKERVGHQREQYDALGDAKDSVAVWRRQGNSTIVYQNLVNLDPRSGKHPKPGEKLTFYDVGVAKSMRACAFFSGDGG